MRGPTAASIAVALSLGAAQPRAPFVLQEATIAQVQAAFRDGRLSCRDLVQGYLRRIDASDHQGPAINALVVLSPSALAEAEALDRRFAAGGPVGPLHWACSDIAGFGHMHMEGGVRSGEAAAAAVLAL